MAERGEEIAEEKSLKLAAIGSWDLRKEIYSKKVQGEASSTDVEATAS